MNYDSQIVSKFIEGASWPDERGLDSRLAEACDVANATVYKWRNGITAPRPEYWRKVEDHLGMDRNTIQDLVDVSVRRLEVGSGPDVQKRLIRMEKLARDLLAEVDAVRSLILDQSIADDS